MYTCMRAFICAGRHGYAHLLTTLVNKVVATYLDSVAVFYEIGIINFQLNLFSSFHRIYLSWIASRTCMWMEFLSN